MNRTVQAVTRLRGSIRPASDKSLTHRGLMFGALGSGESRVQNPLTGEDCLATRAVLTRLGVDVRDDTDGSFVIKPSVRWESPPEALDCGNSGTTMRLMSGILVGKHVTASLVGDASLSRRPMGRVVKPLRAMGAQIEGDTAPLRIAPSTLHGITYDSPVASAQVKSALLLAGLHAAGPTTVREPSLSRDHTERLLRAMGAPILVTHADGQPGVTITAGPLSVLDLPVPADISSAAFWLVAASIVENADIELKEVSTNPTRTGVLDVLARAGITVGISDEQTLADEPRATITIRTPSHRRAFVIEGDLVPRLIDEIPVLAVLATQCEGTTIIRDARELRVKETDRIAVVSDGLQRMGAKVTATEDGMIIEGPTPLEGTVIDADGDHRIGMAFAIAGLIARSPVELQNVDSIATSYPHFWADFATLTEQPL